MMRKCSDDRKAVMTDSAKVESSQCRNYLSAGTTVPSGRHSPSAGGTPFSLHPPRPPGRSPVADHSGRLEAVGVGGTRQKAAEIALPARSGPPCSTERTRGLRVVIPCSTLRPGKENKSGAQARPLEEKEGQSRHPGRRVQRPPRPLRECSRSEERPSCLLMGLLPPHTPEELSGDSKRCGAEE